MLLSLIVPCYNEESMLPLFYKELCGVLAGLNGYTAEVLFVNDGSSDGTLRVVKNLAAQDSRVKYLSFSRNFGKEGAMYAGLQNARGDIVGLLDCDLQDPPSLIPRMLEMLQNGCDSVATRRVTRQGEPPIRSVFARLFYKLINKMADIKLVDGERDFRLMKRPVVDAILKMSEYNRFSKGIFHWVGFETQWIEFENTQRAAGETKWSFFKLFNYAIEGIVSFTTAPLRLATIVGVVSCAVSFIYALYIMIRTLVRGIDVPGYASLLCFILFLGGLTLLCIGIVGEYLARTYLEVKRRPIYIVKESNVNPSDGLPQ